MSPRKRRRTAHARARAPGATAAAVRRRRGPAGARSPIAPAPRRAPPATRRAKRPPARTPARWRPWSAGSGLKRAARGARAAMGREFRPVEQERQEQLSIAIPQRARRRGLPRCASRRCAVLRSVRHRMRGFWGRAVAQLAQPPPSWAPPPANCKPVRMPVHIRRIVLARCNRLAPLWACARVRCERARPYERRALMLGP